MENVILKKKEGKIIAIKLTPSVTQRINNDCELHLCWENCKNAEPNMCKKVADKRKKYLDQYPFVTNGYQVIGEDGKVKQFKVTECANYEKVEKKPLTAEDKKRIRKAKDGLITQYFNSETTDQAYVTQYMQMINGNLKGAENKTLSDKALIDKILKQRDAEMLLEEVIEYQKSKLEEKYVKGKSIEERKAFIKKLEDKLEEVRSERRLKERAHDSNIDYLMQKGITENKIRK